MLYKTTRFYICTGCIKRCLHKRIPESLFTYIYDGERFTDDYPVCYNKGKLKRISKDEATLEMI